ncbi:MAG: hypothetical protein QXG48_05135 [Thermofilaceae archaeon]
MLGLARYVVGLSTLALSANIALDRANPIIPVFPLLARLLVKEVDAFAKVSREVRVFKCGLLIN